jgi:hypothetical protein
MSQQVLWPSARIKGTAKSKGHTYLKQKIHKPSNATSKTKLQIFDRSMVSHDCCNYKCLICKSTCNCNPKNQRKKLLGTLACKEY